MQKNNYIISEKSTKIIVSDCLSYQAKCAFLQGSFRMTGKGGTMIKNIKTKALSIALTGILSVSMLAGCGEKEPDPSENEGTDVASYETTKQLETVAEPVSEPKEETNINHESPMLTELVEAGELPALEDRIPDEENRFVETMDATGNALSIGKYFDRLNIAGVDGSWGLSRASMESIIRYNTDGSYYPNAIRDIDHNEDYTEWTFYLRKGMKWSDGVDFTADDITFWYYMCHLNNYDGKKSWSALWQEIDGEEVFAKLRKIDDYTVKWIFKKPKYSVEFIESGDFKWCWAPAHYLADLIPETAEFPYVENEYYEATGLSEEQVLENAKNKNIEAATAKDLGKAVCYYYWNTHGVPTINSFVLTTEEGYNSMACETCIMERNKYFWKVDAQGNQLPYADALHYDNTIEWYQSVGQFKEGKLDMCEIIMQDIAGTLEELGDDVILREWSEVTWGSFQITFNYTNTDPNYAALFANPDFRQAVSISVDREQVAETVSEGFVQPGQCAPSAGNIGYSKDWMSKWTDYDVEGAKALLEECGLVMGSDGFYDFADGSDLKLTFLSYSGSAEEYYKLLEEYYKAVGLNCELLDYPVDEYDAIIDSNDWIASMGPHTTVGGASLKDRAVGFAPIAKSAEWYGEYGTYYETKGARGVQPTGDMAKLVELYDKWRLSSDEDERDKYQTEIYRLHEKNLWSIAYLTSENSYEIIRSNIKNYANHLVRADCYQYENMAHFEIIYKEE